jgi:hypothetical protein
VLAVAHLGMKLQAEPRFRRVGEDRGHAGLGDADGLPAVAGTDNAVAVAHPAHEPLRQAVGERAPGLGSTRRGQEMNRHRSVLPRIAALDGTARVYREPLDAVADRQKR